MNLAIYSATFTVCLLTLSLCAKREEEMTEIVRDDEKMPYEPPDKGKDEIWSGHDQWFTNFLRSVAKGNADTLTNLLAANKTKEQMKTDIEEWVTKQNSGIQQKYRRLKTLMENKKIEIRSKISSTSMLSDDAKAVLDKLEKIMDDMTITPEEEMKQIQAATSQLKPEVRTQIKDFMVSLRPRHRDRENENRHKHHHEGNSEAGFSRVSVTTHAMEEDGQENRPNERSSTAEPEGLASDAEAVISESARGTPVSSMDNLGQFLSTAIKLEHTLRKMDHPNTMDSSSQSAEDGIFEPVSRLTESTPTHEPEENIHGEESTMDSFSITPILHLNVSVSER